jgi:hypothetical protein
MVTVTEEEGEEEKEVVPEADPRVLWMIENFDLDRF